MNSLDKFLSVRLVVLAFAVLCIVVVLLPNAQNKKDDIVLKQVKTENILKAEAKPICFKYKDSVVYTGIITTKGIIFSIRHIIPQKNPDYFRVIIHKATTSTYSIPLPNVIICSAEKKITEKQIIYLGRANKEGVTIEVGHSIPIRPASNFDDSIMHILVEKIE